jgi:methionine sulfoxide reductase catalytic subunit
MHLRKDRGFEHPIASEITPRPIYEQRRELLKWLAAGSAGAALAGWAGREALAQQAGGGLAKLAAGRSGVAGAMTMEKPTAYKDATTYNNC